jgi:hypothetical protein
MHALVVKAARLENPTASLAIRYGRSRTGGVIENPLAIVPVAAPNRNSD